MLKLFKKNTKQITTRSMPICLCMPLGLTSMSRTIHTIKGKKPIWISAMDLVLLHHQEFGERDIFLKRRICPEAEKDQWCWTSNHTLLVAMISEPATFNSLQTFYLLVLYHYTARSMCIKLKSWNILQVDYTHN